MNAVRSLPPYELLREIEKRSQTKALGLPQQIEVRRTWSGIGFRLGQTQLVSPMADVGANIRGSLLPIMDLSGFIMGDPIRLQRRNRVLVMRRRGLSCGLLVDEVFGLRHFFEEEKVATAEGIAKKLNAFVEGAYQQGEQSWGIFSMRKLAENPEFLEVTARK